MKNTLLQKNRTFFNSWAPHYDWLWFRYWMKKFHFPAAREINFHRRPAPRILDISCGTGELLRSLAEAGKSKLYGVDIAEKMLEKARKKLPSEVKLQKADVHRLPFKSDTFDYVLTTEAFHHYYDQRKALQEMFRVARKGGRVIVVDINFFFKPVHFLFRKLEPGNVKINSRKEMKKLFAEAGLKVEKQSRNFLFAVMTVGVKP